MAFLLYDMMTVAAGLKMMVHVQLFTPPPPPPFILGNDILSNCSQ